MTFADYVGFYGLSRSEGLVLRYLADAYKALRQPSRRRQDRGADDLIEWLGELVRQVDSSLLDEWEQLRNPAERPGQPGRRRGRRRSPRNARAFRVLVRNALFRRVELAALRPLRRARRAGRRRRLGRRALGGGGRAVLRRARRDRHRPGRPRARAAHHRGGPRGLDGPADLRRPGRRPRLGHRAQVDLAASDEAGHGGAAGHRRGPAVASLAWTLRLRRTPRPARAWPRRSARPGRGPRRPATARTPPRTGPGPRSPG